MLKAYIISPYAGNIEINSKHAREYCLFAIKKGYLPIAAHMYFPQFFEETIPKEREKGLEMGMEMLKLSDEAWIFYDNRISSGMAKEIKKAKELKVKLRAFLCRDGTVVEETDPENIKFRYQTLRLENLTFKRFKGNSAPQAAYHDFKDYIVLDLETTGLSACENEIINIGAIKYENDKPIDSLDILVKPKKEISEEITRLTGISNDMVKDAVSIEKALMVLIKFLGKDSIILGHCVDFDLNFLNYNLEIYGFNNYQKRFIDTVTIARSFRKNNSLQNLIQDYIDPDFLQSHKALDDARNTAKLFQFFKKNDFINKEEFK